MHIMQRQKTLFRKNKFRCKWGSKKIIEQVVNYSQKQPSPSTKSRKKYEFLNHRNLKFHLFNDSLCLHIRDLN
jgi:hypothetical protein